MFSGYLIAISLEPLDGDHLDLELDEGPNEGRHILGDGHNRTQREASHFAWNHAIHDEQRQKEQKKCGRQLDS